MRKHDLQSATRIFIRFRSKQAALNNEILNETSHGVPSLAPRNPLTSPVSATRIAPYTSVPRTLVPAVVGVLAGPEAGGVPPFASMYPMSRHGRQPRVESVNKSQQIDGLLEAYPPSPHDLWTRAFTLASKDVKSITSKMLVYFFERGKATYRPWTSTTSTSSHFDAGSNSGHVSSPSDAHHPILDHSIRLSLSHYTTLIHGLLLRRHYPVALAWVRKLIYPLPTFPSHTSSHLKHLLRTSDNPKYSRDSVHLSLDGPALSACLVVLARLGRVHEATTVLEAYAALGIFPSSLTWSMSDRHADARHVQLNTIQMNDFLLVLLRWPSKKHALPVPSVEFPLPFKPVKSRKTQSDSKSNTLDRSTNIRSTSWPAQTTDSTRSARPDLLLRLLPALYPRYGVPWDARTVCLMLQAVRMGAKMDGVSALGLRKVIKNIFGSKTKVKGEEISDATLRPSRTRSKLEKTTGSISVARLDWLAENIMEVLWEPGNTENTFDYRDFIASPSPKHSITRADQKKKKPSHTHAPRQSDRPLEYSPFTPWRVPVSPHTLSSLSSSATAQSISLDDRTNTRHSPSAHPTHPFLLAREIFLRLVWEHAENLDVKESLNINLHTISAPASLPPSSLARLLDPDGDGLGHLGGLPKWFTVLEGALKRKFGFGSELFTIPSNVAPLSSSANGFDKAITTSQRMKFVDEVFGYPQDQYSPALPKLTTTTFYHYILLLGLSAPEPWEFVQAGWNQQYPFEGYPQPNVSACTSTNTTTRSTASTSSPSLSAPTSYISSIPKTSQETSLAHSSPLIPGPSEIPITLAYMRTLRLVPTKDTLCAAVVFWREAVGGETLAELGVRKYKMSRIKQKDLDGTYAREAEEDAYTREYEMWKVSVGTSQSQIGDEQSQPGGRGNAGEYANFCRWIREWVDEINMGASGGEQTLATMPHPYHIHRWAEIVRKMREGQGYEEDDKAGKE
ncbi:hypothetical protein J3R30DRAFT_3696258 [Lentinula aciculospora]|uniref:Uncharacterized protein n=1 Tax=Lentinula aciculospora TaxID=153920 RepID=A0A9W9AQT6_9AGAR|nr:hypothetical protein J3R30DRAFT_3696258 [Lentinula aciculospora]